MAAKGQTSQAYQPLPREDPSAALLAPSDRDDRENGKTPVFRITFSPIMLFRLIIVPFIITDIVFLCMIVYDDAVGGVFASGGILMVLWHASRVFRGLLPGRKNNKFDLKIGNLFCTIGTTSLASRANHRTWSYLVSAVDFSFGLLFIGPSVLAAKTEIFIHDGPVEGLSITVVILQSALAFLNLFSPFRKMRIVAYRGEDDNEEDQDHIYSVDELFRDEVSEPRDSMASDV
ncbi:hypothetical protein F53441_4493 [Fusarium austroafricanum]|uniref:Uncharacterized protein n=1 Tax=Fusarium austroafricanum TaxID=2364996 RepID=A0A8H4P1N2_9HYPO|nr:hypothetical protein F53441_4493 [Fusarium austroafricanum]